MTNTYSGDPVANVVLMEYIGQQFNESIKGLNGREYHGGTMATFKYAEVHPDDVHGLEQSGLWRVAVDAPIESEPVKEKKPTPKPTPTRRRAA